MPKRMRRRMSIWGISSSPCGKESSLKLRRTGLCLLFGEPYEAEFQSGGGIHVCDENGDEILTYTAGVGWHEKELKAEMEVQGGFGGWRRCK